MGKSIFESVADEYNKSTSGAYSVLMLK